MILVGIDGCKGGWLIASAGADLSNLKLGFAPSLAEVFDSLPAETGVAIDMPIGLPDCTARACDVAARKVLGRQKQSSVFPAPCRAALSDGSTPCPRCGKKLAQQGKAILRKIREVDALMRPELQCRVREAHPELTFAVLAHPGIDVSELMKGGTGLKSKKQRVSGQKERLKLLAAYGLRELNPGSEARRLSDETARPKADDVLDALACLVTAHRVFVRQQFLLLPKSSCRDERDLGMEMVA
jgi:predicted RNase H-like nuclease